MRQASIKDWTQTCLLQVLKAMISLADLWTSKGPIQSLLKRLERLACHLSSAYWVLLILRTSYSKTDSLQSCFVRQHDLSGHHLLKATVLLIRTLSCQQRHQTISNDFGAFDDDFICLNGSFRFEQPSKVKKRKVSFLESKKESNDANAVKKTLLFKLRVQTYSVLYFELYIPLVADLHHCQSHLVLVLMATRIVTHRKHLLHFDCRILALPAKRLKSDLLDDCLLFHVLLHRDQTLQIQTFFFDYNTS